MNNYWIVMSVLSGKWERAYDVREKACKEIDKRIKASRMHLPTPLRQIRVVIDEFRFAHSVYSTLSRMQAEGIVEARWIPWISLYSNRAKQYRLTPYGLQEKTEIALKGGLEDIL